MDHSPLSSAVQPVLNWPCCPFIQTTFPRLTYVDVSGDNVKNLPEGGVDTMHWSLLIYPASHSIAEGKLTGRAGLPLGQSVLTTPDNLLLHVLSDDNQDELFHHLSVDRGVTVACSSPSPPPCPF